MCPDSCRVGGKLSPNQWRMVRTIEGLTWDTAIFLIRLWLLRWDGQLQRLRISTASWPPCLGLPLLFHCQCTLKSPAPFFKSLRLQEHSTTFLRRLDSAKSWGPSGGMTRWPPKPSRPPRFNPSPFVDAETGRRFEAPSFFAAAPDPVQRPPPSVRVLASRAQRLELYRKLAACGRLQPVKPSAERIPYAGGLFSVVKDLNRDRLVLDCRPANCLEVPTSKWTQTLAGTSVLAPVGPAPR